MDRRLKLSDMLHEKLPMVNYFYFAPETKCKMSYPCIRYDLSDRIALNADNKKYIKHSAYNVTYITNKPSDSIPVCDALEDFTYSEFVRAYVSDGLYHYLYTIII